MDGSKDQSAALASRSKLRHPLRSATKQRDGKSVAPDVSTASASRRGRPLSSVSKSVSVLDLSAKDKSTKPPRRLSIPLKASASPRLSIVGSITPISESRVKKSVVQGKSITPVSDVSKTISRKKFSVLLSVSYWLSQIKLSESVSKHSISLGFFKLALESGCEPLQRMREELKSYALRHHIIEELGEPARALLQSYNILQELEQLQVSETCSHGPEEGTKSSDEDVNSSSTTARSGKLKPESLNSEALGAAETTKKENIQRKLPAAKNKVSHKKTSAIMGSVKDNYDNSQKKARKPSKLESTKEKGKAKTITKKPASDKVDTRPIVEDIPQENKENMEHKLVEELVLVEEVQTS